MPVCFRQPWVAVSIRLRRRRGAWFGTRCEGMCACDCIDHRDYGPHCSSHGKNLPLWESQTPKVDSSWVSTLEFAISVNESMSQINKLIRSSLSHIVSFNPWLHEDRRALHQFCMSNLNPICRFCSCNCQRLWIFDWLFGCNMGDSYHDTLLCYKYPSLNYILFIIL